MVHQNSLPTRLTFGRAQCMVNEPIHGTRVIRNTYALRSIEYKSILLTHTHLYINMYIIYTSFNRKPLGTATITSYSHVSGGAE